MSVNDTIADLIARIKNGQQASLAHIYAPASKLLENMLGVLQREGYIREYSREIGEDGKEKIRVDLKYYDGEPVIREMKRVSKSGRRSYSKIADLKKVHNGLGIYVLSTSKGVLSDHEARVAKVGGEVLCSVF